MDDQNNRNPGDQPEPEEKPQTGHSGRSDDPEGTEGAQQETPPEDAKTGAGDSGNTTSSRLWTPYGDPRSSGGRAPDSKTEKNQEPGVTEEEMRRRIEEALERITVADVIIDMMITLSSLAYQRMGIPREANEKYRDMEQARLAIDCLDALAKVLLEKMPEDDLKPILGTIDNLKVNYARES